jgi:hypothetical protein
MFTLQATVTFISCEHRQQTTADLTTASDIEGSNMVVKNIDIPRADGLEIVRHKFIQCESVDTTYSEYEDDIGINIDWEKEETILERKRKMTLLVILLAFLVTTVVMVMSVVHVEHNKAMEVSCPKNNKACLWLLCQWEARGEDGVDEGCEEVAGGREGRQED